MLSSCAHRPSRSKLVYEQELPESERVTPYKSSFGEIPLEINGNVNKWIAYYQGRGRSYMETYLERSTRYEELMKAVLRAEGLPEELFYLVFVESGFSAKAYSHASAVGYWQFIHSTGRLYGLKITGFVDERRDPLLSTEASSQYLKSLYNLFGDWKLALAAYNTGENRVKRAVMKYKTRDYWELLRHRRAIPNETKHYVAKFMAAMAIGKNPELYGFRGIGFSKPIEFDAVKVTEPISLKKLADQIGADFEEIKLLNPRYRTDYVPIYKGDSVLVRVPPGLKEKASLALKDSVTEPPKTVLANGFIYRVRSGDTLSTIARRHRISTRTLIRENNLSSRSLLRIGQRLRIPETAYRVDQVGEAVATTAEKESRLASALGAAPGTDGIHVVQKGENLSLIAKRYNTTISDLLKINNLRTRTVLRPGQSIRYRPVDSQSHSGEKKVRKKSHLVRRGETLEGIARRYGISSRRIARANRIKNDSRILAGMRIEIPQ